MAELLLTEKGNLLVKQKEKVGFFTPEKTFIRYSDTQEWEFAVEYWGKKVIETNHSFNYPKK